MLALIDCTHRSKLGLENGMQFQNFKDDEITEIH